MLDTRLGGRVNTSVFVEMFTPAHSALKSLTLWNPQILYDYWRDDQPCLTLYAAPNQTVAGY